METLKHIAIISGGLGDIGTAIAHELSNRGADIALGDLKESTEAEIVLKQLRAKGIRAKYNQIDVAQAQAVKDWVMDVEQELGIPDIIIPCAAQVTFKDTKTITPEQWDKELQVNLNGAFYLAQAGALKLVEQQQPGKIVFIGSFAGVIPQVHHAAYSVSKAGMHALTKEMALEFGPHSILVNAVAPGNVDAGLTKRYYKEHPENLAKDKAVIPIRQLVKAQEVAWWVANLCDPENRNVTGVILSIDGGMSALPDFRLSRQQ